jgi:hypothetical protein
MSKKRRNPRRGSSLDEFLDDEGMLEEATAAALKKALAWQFAEAMKKQHLIRSLEIEPGSGAPRVVSLIIR